MRNLGSICGALGLVLLATGPSRADDLPGAYDVKFEQVSSNCEHPIAYPLHGSIKIEVKGSDLQVDIERTPLMVGKVSKSPAPDKPIKVNARSPRPGHTPIEGMDGVFSVAGRITPEGMLWLVMIGEYQASGKPLCTQSWNLSGLRAHPDKPERPDKPRR
jgi:hypothetical protein